MIVEIKETPSDTAAELIRALDYLRAEGNRQQMFDVVSTFCNDLWSAGHEEGYEEACAIHQVEVPEL